MTPTREQRQAALVELNKRTVHDDDWMFEGSICGYEGEMVLCEDTVSSIRAVLEASLAAPEIPELADAIRWWDSDEHNPLFAFYVNTGKRAQFHTIVKAARAYLQNNPASLSQHTTAATVADVPADDAQTVSMSLHAAPSDVTDGGSWLPIETAPKDENIEFLAIDRKGRYFVGSMVNFSEDWRFTSACVVREVTDWMPLPTPSAKEGEK